MNEVLRLNTTWDLRYDLARDMVLIEVIVPNRSTAPQVFLEFPRSVFIDFAEQIGFLATRLPPPP